MFIDDERFPTDVTWVDRKWAMCYITIDILRSFEDVKRWVGEMGIPSFISFDHDLGEDQPTGYDIAKYLVELDMDGIAQFPDDFQFVVHSKNPIGKINIETYLNNYLKTKGK